MLYELQAADRRVFEWWAPAMSYVPMCDFRYYMPEVSGAPKWRRAEEWITENTQLAKDVLERIRLEGPLGSADFKAPEGFKRGTWWSWKPAKRALEALFDVGELMVTERRKFQRIYDLRERVLPSDVDTRAPSLTELAHFAARRALGSPGFAPASAVSWNRHWARRWDEGEAVQELIDSGEATRFKIAGMDGEEYCALTEILDDVANRGGDERLVHILSPFDNLARQRGLVHRYFGFAYKLEAYTPKAKRRYGYFALPILWGERFVGRVDCKADRRPKAFLIRQLTFEPEFADYDGLLPALAEKLHRFAEFNGCERIVVENTDPAGIAPSLVHALEVGP